MTADRRRFRQLVEAKPILVLPGVFNGFSARLVESYGYKAAAITGAGVSESALGWADRGLLTFDENLRVCRALAECVGIPLLADADTGYGGPLNVYFVVRAFERAGLAAISIEDQLWPKRCGHMPGKSVIPAREMVEKVKAAVDARRDGDFMIRARTDAAATDGIAEVIDRLNAYAEAGADILFPDALMSADDIARVARSVSKPLSINMGFGLIERGTTPLLTPRQLQDLGVAAVSYSRLLTSSALRGMMNALDAFAETVDAPVPRQRPELMLPFGKLNELMGLNTLEDLEKRWTSANE
jgi:2-methylisocitrate lyase-like PEP mutase family enzyme